MSKRNSWTATSGLHLSQYRFLGKPCVQCRSPVRYKSDKSCVRCAIKRTKSKSKTVRAREQELQRKRSLAWRRRNPEREHERYRRWAEQNREHLQKNKRIQGSRRRHADGSFTDVDETAMYQAQHGLCAYFSYCGNELGDDYARDHIVPICKGGSHWPSNRQLTCHRCNAEKGHKNPEEFAAEVGLTSQRALLPENAPAHFSRHERACPDPIA